MSRLFLGKWWHWAVLIGATLALWLAGDEKMHVVHFNAFILSLLAATAFIVAVLVATSRPGERVTRDRLDSHTAPPPEASDARPGRSDAD